MSETEKIIEQKLIKAFGNVKSLQADSKFSTWFEIPDAWLESNEDLFMYYSHKDEKFLLPAFLCYMLRNFQTISNSYIYEHILGTLREASKCKHPDAFKYQLTTEQFNAIHVFIKHFRYNLPVNIDVEYWDKILKNWQR